MRSSLRASLLVGALFCIACVDNKKKAEPADASVQAASVQAPLGNAPAASGKPRLTVESCEKILVEGEQNLSKERARADKSCAKDDDCMLVPSGVCAPSCVDYAMARTAMPAYAQRRKEIDRASCLGWRDNDCATITPKPEPTCGPLKANCQNKTCTATPGATK